MDYELIVYEEDRETVVAEVLVCRADESIDTARKEASSWLFDGEI